MKCYLPRTCMPIILSAFLTMIIVFVSFLPIVFASGPLPTFEAARTYNVAPFPTSITSGDFNNDSKLDIVVAASGRVDVLLGDGAGNFSAPITVNSADENMGAQPTDFNGDGNLDLAVGLGNSALGIGILFGDGTGHLTPFVDGVTTFAAGDRNTYVTFAVGDMNHDNKPDIVQAEYIYSPGDIPIMLGDGLGGISGVWRQPLGGIQDFPNWPTIADINGDGFADVALPEGTILISDGAETFIGFPSFPAYPTYRGANTLVAADFNSDGKMDIATSQVTVFLQDEDGIFLDGVYYEGGGSGIFGSNGNGLSRRYSVNVADINGDGKIDLVTAYSVLLGDGNGGFGSLTHLAAGSGAFDVTVGDFNSDGRPDIATVNSLSDNSGTVSVLLNSTYQTPVGEDTTVTVGQTSFTFDNVTAGGTTTVTSIADPSVAGEVPGGFAVSELAAFEVQTTATFTGSIVVGFQVPFVDADNNAIDDNTGTAFSDLRILHREQTGTQGGNPVYSLVDRTILPPDSPAPNLATRTVYARVTSFSPFYLERVGNKVQSLFDRSRAYRAGSTIPVKVRLLGSSNQNISSPSTVLTARNLRLIGANTTSSVIDSGNANPDSNFRYDASLGGYIFNLSTRGLAAGRYVLSFYAGSDHSFFYTVEFEVR
jgi:hypothetical protein